MAKQTVNLGTPNGNNGDPLRTAFAKVNDNFTELYTALGLDVAPLNLGAFEFSGSTMSTTDSSAITIDQATTISSNLTVGGDILPSVANGGDLGSSANPWRSLYVSNNTIYIGGNALKIDSNGDLTLNNNRIVQENGEYLVLDNLTDVIANSPSVGDVLTWNGGSWVNGGQVDLGKFKISNNNLGTVDNPNTGGWGGYDINIDPGNGSDAAILIPGLAGQASGTALQIYTLGDATSPLQLWGRGNVQLITGQGATEKVFTVESDSLIFPDSTTQTTAWTGVASRIESENDISIKINLTDSTQRIWRFGEDGELTFPDGTVQATAFTGAASSLVNGANTVSLGSDGTLTLPGTGTIRTAFGAMSINAPTGSSNLSIKSSDATTYMIVGNGSAGVTAGAYNWQFSNTGNLTFPNSTVQTTAWTGNFGYLTAEKDTIKGTADYQYTFATDGYFTSSTSSESTNYFFVTYNTTNTNIAAGWTVVGGTANTTVSSVTYPVAGYPGVIRVNLTAAASSTSGFYPVTVTSPDRLRVEIQPNPSTSDKFTFTTSGLTFPDGSLALTNSVLANGLDADIKGSVFGDDSTKIIDAIENKIYTNELTFTDGTITAGKNITVPLDEDFTVTLQYDMMMGQGVQQRQFIVSDNSITLPTGNGVIFAGSGTWGLDSANKVLSFPNNDLIHYDGSAGGGGSDYGLNLFTYTKPVIITSGQTNNWTFGTDGNLTIPGDIKSQGNINIEINLGDSTLRRWQFGEDGDLRFPDTTVQTTAFTGNASTVDITNTNGIDTNYSITFVENRDTAQYLRGDVDLTFNSATNLLTSGNVAIKQTLTGGINDGGDFIITTLENTNRNNACSIGIYPGLASGTASEAGLVSIAGGDSDVVGLAGGDVYLRGGTHTNGGTDGIIRVQSILKIDDGVHEKLQTKTGATGTVTHDCASGHIFYHTSPSANWTANFTNLNLSTGYATAVTLVIVQGGTGYYPNVVQIGGVGQTINWQGNTTPTPSANRTDVVTFSILNNGLYTVLGQLTGF